MSKTNEEMIKANERIALRKNKDALARALVMTSGVSKADEVSNSRAMANPWSLVKDIHTGAIEPPFDPLGLIALDETSNQLSQNISTYSINIDGFGWRLKVRKDCELAARDNPDFKAKIDEEHSRFHELLTYIDYDENSFVKLRKNTRSDLERTGNAYWEVLRDRKGRVCSLRLIPSGTMRLTPKGEQAVLVKRARHRGKGEDTHIGYVNVYRRFRRFVQARFTSGSSAIVRYFREYGDPRPLDAITGVREDEAEVKVPATEIIHHSIYSSRSPYGVPRYIGNILSAFGSRKSEEINYTTFTNNNVPSMALMISNGSATEGTVDRLKSFIETSIQGSDNFSKILLIEADPLDDDGDNVRIELKPLTKDQHTDALFQEYDLNNQKKIRGAFRLPPALNGATDDYTRSTIETSRKLADEQVFQPERDDEDFGINKVLMDEGMLYHEFKTRTPNVTNDQDLIAIVAGAERSGAMTPRIARGILEDILNQDLPEHTADYDLDVPFSLSMAEAVKNLAKPNEPGQQVTALKSGAIDNSWYDRIIAAQPVAKNEEFGEELASIAFNAGSQANDLAAGEQKAYLSDINLGLAGKEMYLADGLDLVAKVRFGETVLLKTADAALAAGMSVDDATALFPGKGELYVLKIDARDAFAPIAFDFPLGELFGVVTFNG
jgi:PBSX family phage portal protein